MARLPRLAVPGHAHWVIQRALPGLVIFMDDADRQAWLAAVRESCVGLRVQVHAWALLPHEVQLLLTPPDAEALSKAMQSIGRRYVAAFNRRHRRAGTLWDGRFRAAAVEPGAKLLEVLRIIDAAAGPDASRLESSAAHRLGRERATLIVDPAEYWRLGNTPFDREIAWSRLLAAPMDAGQAERLRQAALGGWALGSPSFVTEVAASTGRPATPRPRGRPRQSPPG